MSEIIMLHDLPEDPNNPDGPTIREVNLQKTHKYPIDSVVEAKLNSYKGDGISHKVHGRFYVVSHDRDCDGTPLYSLADVKVSTVKGLIEYYGNEEWDLCSPARQSYHIRGWSDVHYNGIGEECLTPVDISAEEPEPIHWTDEERYGGTD